MKVPDEGGWRWHLGQLHDTISWPRATRSTERRLCTIEEKEVRPTRDGGKGQEPGTNLRHSLPKKVIAALKKLPRANEVGENRGRKKSVLAGVGGGSRRVPSYVYDP